MNLNKFKLVLIAATAFTCIGTAQASTITMSTRPIASLANSSGQDYVDNWNDALAANPTAPSGYGDTTLTEFNEVSNQSQGTSTQNVNGTNTNISFYFDILFNVSAANAGEWDFSFQNDFGLGGAVYLDGSLIEFKNFDLNGTDPSMIFSFSQTLSVGNHIIQIYGQENCCDGYHYGQFAVPGGELVTFSSTDGIDPVPIPAALPLLLSSLGLLGFFGWRKRKAAAQ